MNKEYVPLFLDFNETTQDLTDEECGRLIRAVVKYANGDDSYSDHLAGAEKIAFRFMKGQVDRNKSISNARKEAIRSRWDNVCIDENIQTDTNEYKTIQTDTKNTTKTQNPKTNTKKQNPKTETENKKTPAPTKISYAEHVRMTEAEYETLVEKYGYGVATECIEKLENYKASSGKNYKSDYHAILSWVLEEVLNKHSRPQQQQKPSTGYTNPFLEMAKKFEEEGI